MLFCLDGVFIFIVKIIFNDKWDFIGLS